jgi:hypothetical protein
MVELAIEEALRACKSIGGEEHEINCGSERSMSCGNNDGTEIVRECGTEDGNSRHVQNEHDNLRTEVHPDSNGTEANCGTKVNCVSERMNMSCGNNGGTEIVEDCGIEDGNSRHVSSEHDNLGTEVHLDSNGTEDNC